MQGFNIFSNKNNIGKNAEDYYSNFNMDEFSFISNG
jgi:hypothetical protein